MKFQKAALLLLFFIISILAIQAHSAYAQGMSSCTEGFPEDPALPEHLEQDRIASGELSFRQIFHFGEKVFGAVWNRCDGQGRPATTGGGDKRVPDEPAFIRTSAPEASSCAGCHNQPRMGGGGDFVVNVFVLAQTLDPVTVSVAPEFSNERNTLGMFGAGPIEMLGREMTAELQRIRKGALNAAAETGVPVSVELLTKGVSFGSLTAYPDGTVDTSACRGVDPDLVVKPFHQAGVVRSIREFTVNAMNHHHGMQAEERFDLYPGKGPDFDEDGFERELTIGDITAATIFQAALGTPGRVLPSDREARAVVELGEVLFEQVGCTSCHIPEFRLENRYFVEPNFLNPAGTFNETGQEFSFDMTKEGEKPRLEKVPDGGAILRPYTDLKRHNLCDPLDHPNPVRYFCNEQLAQGRPEQDGMPGEQYFLTRKLWDVGNSAPYGHRGDLTTITEAILAHGGEARAQRDAFAALDKADQAALVLFLKTLQVLPGGSPLVIYEPDLKVNAGFSPWMSLPLVLGGLTSTAFWFYKKRYWRG